MSQVAVIPARRAERTIRATLESLRLGNADVIREVVVVTSSGDPTADVVGRWAAEDPCVRLQLLPVERTAGRARNDGCRAARAEAWLFVDADCRLEAGGAARLVRELERSGAAAVTPRIAGSGGVVARVRHMLEFKEAASARPAPEAWIPPSTVMLCRAEAFRRTGGFPDLWPGEDLVFGQSLRDLGENVLRVPDVVAVHEHPRGFVEMLRHQWRLGRTSAIARRMKDLGGSVVARRRLLAPLVLPARAVRLALWQMREGPRALVWSVVLSPLLLAGLCVWSFAFVVETARPSGRRAGAARCEAAPA